MQALFGFFGQLFCLALIVCALALMVAPSLGQEIAKRAGVALLLFIAATMLLPYPSQSGLPAAGRTLLSVSLMVASLFYLVQPEKTSALLGRVALGAGALFVVLVGLGQLWRTTTGRLMILALPLVAGLFAYLRSRGE